MKDVGWKIRTIKRITGSSVTLEDGVSFCSPCFDGAKVGEVWAVYYESGLGFGSIKKAKFVQAAGDDKNEY